MWKKMKSYEYTFTEDDLENQLIVNIVMMIIGEASLYFLRIY